MSDNGTMDKDPMDRDPMSGGPMGDPMGGDPVEMGAPSHESTPARRRRQRLAGAVGLLLAGGLAGGAVAATSSATAASSPASSASSPAATPGPGSHDDTATSGHQGEKAQTGTNLSTLKAAALKAVPGGTVIRVETDGDGSAYEAHMTKADGTHVTVEFDKNLKVTEVGAGMGAGRAGGHHGDTHPDGPGGHDGGSPSSGKNGS
jgi:hypothetical protein